MVANVPTVYRLTPHMLQRSSAVGRRTWSTQRGTRTRSLYAPGGSSTSVCPATGMCRGSCGRCVGLGATGPASIPSVKVCTAKLQIRLTVHHLSAQYQFDRGFQVPPSYVISLG